LTERASRRIPLARKPGYHCGIMDRRQEWKEILDAEVERWSALTCDELIAALPDGQWYEVMRGAKAFQVEVEVLENTDTYVHVLVAVDDGTLPASMWPLTRSIICRRGEASSPPSQPG
jgi:hypothetical protein